jgi:hypothetical protein
MPSTQYQTIRVSIGSLRLAKVEVEEDRKAEMSSDCSEGEQAQQPQTVNAAMLVSDRTI